MVLGGDQQTYALVKTLIKKYPDTFQWIFPMIGDWYCLTLASECIKSILWHGGLHQLGIECGHLKDIIQWHDIHNLLVAVHEGMLSCAMKSSNNDMFSMCAFIDNTSNKDKQGPGFFLLGICAALSQCICWLLFCHQGGSFALRNACLPKIAELFFLIQLW